MKLPVKLVLMCGFFISPSLAVLAQSGPASLSIALQMRTGRSYKTGSPYCAMKEYFPTETPPDGAKAGHTERVCRDSLGRGRDEISPTSVEIYDPVEGFAYTLDTDRARAGRTVIARPASPDSSAFAPLRPSFSPEPSQPVVEPLGTQVIEGLVVEGVRITTPDPIVAGEHKVEERWFSRELDEVIFTKGSGQMLWRLTGIDRSEPDPSLFQVPPSYAVEDTLDYGDVPSPATSSLKGIVAN